MTIIPFRSPSILQSASGGTPAQRLQAYHSARLTHYHELREFYQGKHFTSSRRGHSNIVANYARAIVDKGVAFLFARGVVHHGFQQTSAKNDPIANALARIYHDAALGPTLLQAATNASVLGDAVLKIMWHHGNTSGPAGPEGSTKPHAPTPAGAPRILNIDPGRYFPTFTPDDPTEPSKVQITWSLTPDEARARYQMDLGRTTEAIETWTATTFEIQLGGQKPVQGPNPYGFIPFIHVPNLAPPNSPWGVSDLEDIIPLNRELDLRLNDQADLIRYHADPPVVFRGVREHSDLAVGPGTIWDIPTDAAVELLEWKGQPPAVEQHQTRILTAIYDVSESPRSSFGETTQAFSGVALEAQMQPIVQRTLRRRIVWEPALERLGRYALMLAEQFDTAGTYIDRSTAPLRQTGTLAPYRVQIRWHPMLPRNDAEEANRFIALTGAGLRSLSGAMEAMGIHDPEQELQQTLADREKLGMEPTAVAPFQHGSLEETVP